MGPVQFALLTYLILTIIALAVAGVIQITFGIIKMRNNKATAHAAAGSSKK